MMLFTVREWSVTYLTQAKLTAVPSLVSQSIKGFLFCKQSCLVFDNKNIIRPLFYNLIFFFDVSIQNNTMFMVF